MTNRRTPSWPGAPWRLLLAVLAATCIAAGGVSASGPGDDLNVAFNRLPQPTAGVPQRLASRSTASDTAFRFLFVDQIPNAVDPAERFYVNRLMRAAGRLLARSVRVRGPSTGLIDVSPSGRPTRDFLGDPIPDPPSGADGYDADLVVLFKRDADSMCTGTLLASAGALLVNDVTGRPVVGQVLYCNVVVGDFEYDLGVMVHELLHILGMSSSLFGFYRNYPPVDDDSFPAVTVVKQISDSEQRQLIGLQFPQQLQNARTFFNCPSMAYVPFEDTPLAAIASAHWEQTLFDGEIMEVAASPRALQTHMNRQVLTDQTLQGWWAGDAVHYQ